MRPRPSSRPSPQSAVRNSINANIANGLDGMQVTEKCDGQVDIYHIYVIEVETLYGTWVSGLVGCVLKRNRTTPLYKP